MKHRITIALAAAACAAIVAVSPVAADPTWPPRPVQHTYNYCVQGRNVSGCITLPRKLGKAVDKLTGVKRVCNVPGGVCK
jgi:hypothetical protein